MRVPVLLIMGLLALAMVVLAACGGATSTPPAVAPPPQAADHNAADVAFLQGMLPHHTQATSMASQAPTRAGSPEVKALADRIDRAQGPEIEQMSQMLAAWGEPRPQPGSMGGMGGMPMSGMMSEQQMAGLTAASGPAFDRMFLQMMIEHHRGAITMAQDELRLGQNPQAKALAEKIIADQQAEITKMQALLDRV